MKTVQHAIIIGYWGFIYKLYICIINFQFGNSIEEFLLQ